MYLFLKALNLYNKGIKTLSRKYDLEKLKRLPNTRVHSTLKIGDNTFFQIDSRITELTIEENVSWKDNNAIRMRKGATLRFEKNSYMSDFVSINCLDKIIIGENSWIGESSKLYDHNHAYDTGSDYKWHVDKFQTSPIIIGKNVKIYSNVTILRGVTIGDNSIIGTGCIIYESIPPYSLVYNKTENQIKSLR